MSGGGAEARGVQGVRAGEALVSISIVSHLQISLVLVLLQDLERVHARTPLEVLLTLNVPEEIPFTESGFGYSLRILRNTSPLGFGANHNRALRLACGTICCILNPDIRIIENPFPCLLPLLNTPGIGLVAPSVVNTSGHLEDSARYFPTPWRIARRFVHGHHQTYAPQGSEFAFPDWVAGMFMVVPTALFRQLGGFDEKFFLYYEDVDFCARIRLHGLRIALQPQVQVIHDARRSSHRKVRYFLWHAASMLRFFSSTVFLRLQWYRLTSAKGTSQGRR